MKSCGVIVEYNPFHNGHQYHIQQARLKTGADVVIAVMSGNFLQRGEPALLDKWTRSEMALAAGVDLVVELPVYGSVQAADYFAKGGIELLQALQCDSFCFGSESGEAKEFQQVAKWLVEEKETFNQAFQQIKNSGSSYAAQVETILKKVYPNLTLNLSEPNNALGLSYAKANLTFPKPMEMVTVKREKAGYHETEIQDLEFASATAIRKSLLEKEFFATKSVMPGSSMNLIDEKKFVTWENYWPYLQYQLMVSTVTDLQQIYQMNEGIEFRLKEKVKEAKSFAEFVGLVKNKRYTWARIQRLCLYVLLQLKKTDVDAHLKGPEAIRVLGFTEQGRSYLKAKKAQIQLPIVSNLNAVNKTFFELDIRAGFVYQLGNTSIAPQDYRRRPINQSNHECSGPNEEVEI